MQIKISSKTKGSKSENFDQKIKLFDEMLH